MMTNEIFLDTSYTVALYIETDQHHEIASAISRRLRENRTKLITTVPIVFEIGNAFSSIRLRSVGGPVIEALSADPLIDVVPISEYLYTSAIELYRSRQDKNWGLSDCFSFVVMRERGLTEALTSDIHFQQAGFRRLLIDND